MILEVYLVRSLVASERLAFFPSVMLVLSSMPYAFDWTDFQEINGRGTDRRGE
jgi:hypothetical protein